MTYVNRQMSANRAAVAKPARQDIEDETVRDPAAVEDTKPVSEGDPKEKYRIRFALQII